MLLLILFCAFRSGSDRFYLKRAAGFKAGGKDVFFYFKSKRLFTLIAFYLNFYLRKLLVIAFCFFPFLVTVLFLNRLLAGSVASKGLTWVLIAVSATFFVNGLVFFFRFNSFFFLARYYFVSGGYKTFRQLFSFSFKQMAGRRGEVFRKRLSFVPWFFSCILLLPISFVRSYYNQSMADLAAYLMEL